MNADTSKLYNRMYACGSLTRKSGVSLENRKRLAQSIWSVMDELGADAHALHTTYAHFFLIGEISDADTTMKVMPVH